MAAACTTAALTLKGFIETKRRIDPYRKMHAWVLIDECQYFPQGFLYGQLVVQARSENIHLVFAQHNLEQAGDYVETLLMAQTKLIYGAAPGERTDRVLQALFRTKREFLSSFNRADVESSSRSVGESVGPTGRRVRGARFKDEVSK